MDKESVHDGQNRGSRSPEYAKALQHLLSRSFYAKILAVKRIISNKGKRTPGIDGVIWKTHRQYWYAVLSLTTRNYKVQPLRRCWIPKSNGQQRH